MKSQYLFLGCLLLLYVCRVYSTIYYPSFCEQQCTESEFIPRLNAQNANRGTTHNRAYLWAALGLLQIQKNFANVSPPSAGRICGLIGTCLYAATEIVDQRKNTPFTVFAEMKSRIFKRSRARLQRIERRNAERRIGRCRLLGFVSTLRKWSFFQRDSCRVSTSNGKGPPRIDSTHPSCRQHGIFG